MELACTLKVLKLELTADDDNDDDDQSHVTVASQRCHRPVIRGDSQCSMPSRPALPISNSQSHCTLDSGPGRVSALTTRVCHYTQLLHSCCCCCFLSLSLSGASFSRGKSKQMSGRAQVWLCPAQEARDWWVHEERSRLLALPRPDLLVGPGNC